MEKPAISIIVPVFNIEAYLPQCLDSILTQTFSDFEVVCVNDGSTDTSLQILEDYAMRDERVVVISQENSGASCARNAALDYARGDYIMFVDGDDWIERDTCRLAYDAAVAQCADVIMWDYVREFANASKPKNIFNSDKNFDEDAVRCLHRRMVGLYADELATPEKADALSTIWGKLYRRNVIYDKSIRFYDIRKIGTFEDGLFNLHVFENVKKAGYIHRYLAHYRKTNDTSITAKYKADLQEKHEHLHKYLERYIAENCFGAIYDTALQNRIAMELVGYGLNILKLQKGRVGAISNILKDAHYKKAIKQLEVKHMPLHWKVFYVCAKCRCSIGVYILLVCIKKIIRG